VVDRPNVLGGGDGIHGLWGGRGEQHGRGRKQGKRDWRDGKKYVKIIPMEKKKGNSDHGKRPFIKKSGQKKWTQRRRKSGKREKRSDGKTHNLK